MRQIARLKQQRYFSFTFYKTQWSYDNIMCICCFIDSVVKIVLYLPFLYTKDDRLRQIKKKHGWWNNRFSDLFSYRLNLKHFASLFFLTQDNSDNFYVLNKKFILFFQPWLLNQAALFLKKCFDHNVWNGPFEIMKNVLTLLVDANLKKALLMTSFHCVISNFEKKNVPSLTKDFLLTFSEL